VCTVWRAKGTRFFLRSTPTKVCYCKQIGHRHLISSLLTFFFYFYNFNMNKSGTIPLCPFVPEPTDPFRYYLHNFVCKTCIGKMSQKQTLDNIGKVMK